MDQLKNTIYKYRKTIVAVLFVLMILYMRKSVFSNVMKIEYKDRYAARKEYDIHDCDVRQEFVAREDLYAFYAYLTNYNDEDEDATVTIYDAKTNKLLSEQSAVVAATGEPVMVGFNMYTQGVEAGSTIYFKVSGKKGVVLDTTEGIYDETLTIDGEKVNARAMFLIRYTSTRDWPSFILTVLLAILSIWVLFYPDKERVQLHKLVFLFIMLAGITFAYINPLGQECDGWEHTLRSIDVSNGNVLSPIVQLTHKEGEIIVPQNVQEIGFEQVNPNNGVAFVSNLKQLHFDKNTVAMNYESSFVSLFYWPQGLGLAIGRGLNLSVFASLFLGRMLNLLVYAVLVYFAIKQTPVYKNIFAVVSMIPMTLYQSASCSPDAILVGLCILFIAKCFYLAYGEQENLGVKEIIPLTVVLGFIFLCKYVYVCIGLLVFLIPINRFENKKKYFKTFIICILPLIILALAMRSVLTSSVSLLASEADGMTQMQFVTHNPIKYCKIMLRTMEQQFSEYVLRLDVLGWLSYTLNFLIVVIPGFLLGVAILDTGENEKKVKAWHKWLGGITFFGAFALTLTGLYVGDGRINPYGAEVIQGFQGRYFIPVLVPGMMVFNSIYVKNEIRNFSYKVVGWMGLFLCYASFMLRTTCY